MGVQDNLPGQPSPYQQMNDNQTPYQPSYQATQQYQNPSQPSYDPSQFQQPPPPEQYQSGAIINNQQYQQQPGYQPLMNNQPSQAAQQAGSLQQLNAKINNGLSCIFCAACFYMIAGSLSLGFNIYSGITLMNSENDGFFTEDEIALIVAIYVISMLSDLFVIIAAVKMFRAIDSKKARDISIARCLLIIPLVLIVATIFMGAFISIIGLIIISIVIAQLSTIEQDMLKRDNIMRGNQIHQA